jgi:hypothetical protein
VIVRAMVMAVVVVAVTRSRAFRSLHASNLVHLARARFPEGKWARLLATEARPGGCLGFGTLRKTRRKSPGLAASPCETGARQYSSPCLIEMRVSA